MLLNYARLQRGSTALWCACNSLHCQPTLSPDRSQALFCFLENLFFSQKVMRSSA